MNILFTIVKSVPKDNKCGQKKKKKKKAENVKGKRGRGAQTPPIYIYVVKKNTH